MFDFIDTDRNTDLFQILLLSIKWLCLFGDPESIFTGSNIEIEIKYPASRPNEVRPNISYANKG